MGADGLIFTNLGQSLSQKVGFFKFLSKFYELTFLTKCWLFQMRSPPLSLFWLLWLLCCHNFVQILIFTEKKQQRDFCLFASFFKFQNSRLKIDQEKEQGGTLGSG